ncbi:hypothetical protein B0O99DRAFT_670663 [Bisporella sp. PMI_857]|nr:hypothetical protein B0O99DRAFT_670663 [Bisporella sp. PMI_857]
MARRQLSSLQPSWRAPAAAEGIDMDTIELEESWDDESLGVDMDVGSVVIIELVGDVEILETETLLDRVEGVLIPSGDDAVVVVALAKTRLFDSPVILRTKQEHAELIPRTASGVQSEAYVGSAAISLTTAVVKVRQNGVASTLPSRIMARKQLSSWHPIGIERFPSPMLELILVTSPEEAVDATLKSVTVIVTVTVTVDVMVGIMLVEELLLFEFVEAVGIGDPSMAVLGTKQEQAELMLAMTFGVHIEAYVGRAARSVTTAVVKDWQNGVASTFPSRIMARRQLSSWHPTGTSESAKRPARPGLLGLLVLGSIVIVVLLMLAELLGLLEILEIIGLEVIILKLMVAVAMEGAVEFSIVMEPATVPGYAHAQIEEI